jgi:hypothetical protein
MTPRLPAIGEQPYGQDLLDWLRVVGNANGRVKGAATVKNISDDAYSGSAAGNDSLDNTAALLAALDDINTAGGGTLYLPPGGTYRYSSIYKVMTAPLTIIGYGATLKSTLGKTADTIAFHLEGNNIAILGGTFDYTVPVNIDTDAPGPVNGITIRLGRTGVGGVFYTGALIRDVTVNNSRNVPINVLGYSVVRIIDVNTNESLGAGIWCSDCPEDIIIRGPIIKRCGDDGIAVMSDPALPALCKRVTIDGFTVKQCYAHGVDLTGVDGATVDHGHIESTWANGILVWHDAADSLGNCKNVYIGDDIIIKDAGRYFGAGQFKTVPTGAAYGVNVNSDVDDITVGYPTIINPHQGPMTFGVTGTGIVRRTGLPPQGLGAGGYAKTYGVGVGTTVLTANAVIAVPIVIPRIGTATSINIRVTSAGAAGSVIRLGLYADTGAFNPRSLIADGGTVDGTTTGLKTATISVPVKPGIYWLVAVGQGAPATQPTVNSLTGQAPIFDASPDPATGVNGYFQLGVTGALPSTFTNQGQTATGVALTLGLA